MRLAAVTATLTWTHLDSDVGYETYKAHRRGPTPLEAANYSEPTRLTMIAVKRSVFQSVASMCVLPRSLLRVTDGSWYGRALPAFTIHTAVKQAKKALANAQNPRIRVWGPTATGLAIVPALPYIFDKPVEHATDIIFEWIEKQIARSGAASEKSEL